MKLTEAKLKSLINQVINESQNNPTQFEEGMVAEALEFCKDIAESAPNPREINLIFYRRDKGGRIPDYGMRIEHALQRIEERDIYFNRGVKQDLSRTSKPWDEFQMIVTTLPVKQEGLSDEMKQEAERKEISYAVVEIVVKNNENRPGEPLSINFQISNGFLGRKNRNVLFESSDFGEIRGDLYGFIAQMFSSKEVLAQQVIDMV